MLSKIRPKKILLLFILVIAVALRFYHFNQLPFTWDELSAWSRLHFDSFSDLIEYGIKPDGHPAGVQVFLYFWTALLGDKEYIVKLPFNLMGVVSVYMIYKIGEIWWSKNTGLVSAAYLSSMQFFVLYSPIARPYVSGLFFTLMMVYFWSYYMFKVPDKKHLAGFIIFAALSSYNHHFSLLFAAIVGLTGLMIVPKNALKEYILAGLLIFILYIPHLPIFFHQLGIGGIGGDGNWLAKPSPYFIINFIQWAFHYSSWVIMLFLLLVVIAFVHIKSIRNNHYKWRKILILNIWVFLPIVIGYSYSILVNPVIQFSMLIFSFPYLFLIVFSTYKEIKLPFLIPLIVLIIGLNIYTLIHDRKHFQIIFNQPFNSTADILVSQKNINAKDIFLIHNYIPEYQNYYLEKNNLGDTASISIYNKNYTLSKMDSLLGSIKQDYVLLSGLPENYIALATQYFPGLLLRKNGYTYEAYLLSREESSALPLHSLISSLDFNHPTKHWEFSTSRINKDSLQNNYFSFLPKQEWGFYYSDSLKEMCGKYGGIIDMEIEFNSSNKSLNPVWVATISTDKTENKIWRGQNFKNQFIQTQKGQKSFFSLDTRLLLPPSSYHQNVFKTYIWNKNKDNFRISKINIYCRAPNPIKYALFQKVIQDD